MPQPSDGTSPSQFARIRVLFERAWELPPAQREAFVVQQAPNEPALQRAVRNLLAQAGAARTAVGSDAARQFLADLTAAPGPDRVQSTATSELLAKLATSPKLDTQRYVLEGEVGRGGMGAVIKIHDQQLNRRLAMKVLLDREAPRDDYEQQLAHQFLGRFLEEAQVTSQLQHPGVVPVHELGLDQDGKVYFTMRLVKGRTASDIFELAKARKEDWTITRALEVILKVCDTMSYAHEKGVLHRDLKPSNVMVGAFGEVYVMDWGLAKVLDQADRHDLRIAPKSPPTASRLDTARKRDADSDEAASVLSMDGQKLGTPSYMAPEQARSEALDVRADVYSIGAMLYDLLTGRAPYTVPGVYVDAYHIMKEVADGPPKRIEAIDKDVPAELVAIVDKAMARDREQRYGSTRELAADLRAFVDQRAVQAYRTGALVELQLWVRRNKPLAASLAAAVLILVAGIVVSTTLANENAVLAAQKTDLAVAETKAKNDALAQKQRADEQAKANALLAQEKTELAASETAAKETAQRTASQLAATVRNFNQLSADVVYRRTIANEKELWPAWPDKVAAMERWLREDCGKLLLMEPEIRRTVDGLRSQSLPLTTEQVEADRRSHPKFAEFELLTKQVASLRYAQAIRSGRQSLVVPELTPEQQALDTKALNALAWPRVAPKVADRTVWGEEALGLAAARAAVAKDGGSDDGYQYLDTLAWALLANGQDAEAKAKSAEALADAPGEQHKDYAAYQRDLGAAIDNAAAILSKVEATLAELKTQVGERRTWMFAANEKGEAARFLHETLTELLGKLASLAQKEKVDVEQRLRWAREVAAVSKAHPLAMTTWAAAREAIARADGVAASTLYAGISIPLPDEAVIGLVPIAMNPVTKLWEFYELRSAWDGKQALGEIAIPTHKTDGSIEVTGATGIVFVLLPGGTVTLGSQRDDQTAPHYDAQRVPDETVHPVTLSPFFLARHELTQGQWSRLMTWDAELRDPSNCKAGTSYFAGKRITLAHPVEQVDWPMCDRLLTRHGLVLPSEAQWEYGCRGGTTTPWNVTLADLRKVANVADADAKRAAPAWNCETWADGHVVHAPVGSFGANGFGLYDVHGNVFEWCRDHYSDYGSERSGDGVRPDSADRSALRVLRGGGFDIPAANARSAYRHGCAPSLRSDALGLRPARLITY